MTGTDGGTAGPDGGGTTSTDSGTTTLPDSGSPGSVQPGGRCACDADCAGTDTHPGICVLGICMNQASGACSDAGSRAECPDGSRCWGLSDTSVYLCWPDCDAFSCEGNCDADGSCVPTEDDSCNPACGSLCGPGECSPDNPMGVCADDGQACLEGTCVDACSSEHPEGYCPPGSTCESGTCRSTSGCPTWMCTGASCADIVPMPGSYDASSREAHADGYYIATYERYAYLRRDLTQLIQYAACEVAARYPGTEPIGLSDLSQADGRTPGTDTGSPRHPTSTHRGDDMDLAYYQTDGTNDPQIICGDGSDRNPNGTPGTYNDGYFCTTEENIIDWPRQAYWFAKLASTPLVRVFGIDETLPDDFERELRALYDAGEITSGEYERARRLGYGSEGGWAFHHHHTHMSYNRP